MNPPDPVIFAGTFDLTVLILWVFLAFFAGLILYLRREDRREGYPLEHDVTGVREPTPGAFFYAAPKTFSLPGGGSVSKPDGGRDDAERSFRRTSVYSGTPIEPVGDPLTAGVGPGSWAARADVPDMMHHGGVRLKPLRGAAGFSIDKKDPDVRGYTLIGFDGKPGGTVVDLWVDRSEYLVRYLEVAVPDAGGATLRTVLIPINMCLVQKPTRTVATDSVTAAQVAGAPGLADPEQVTLLEEEKIMAYFGAGYLYATPQRSEPVV